MTLLLASRLALVANGYILTPSAPCGVVWNVPWKVQLAVLSRTALLRLVQLLGRFVPVVSRGLALGFAVLAIAVAFFGMGDYPAPGDRTLVAVLYAAIALVSFTVGVAVRPILRWILRRG